MQHLVIAVDKFKASATAAQVASCLAKGLRPHLPEQEFRITELPLADGGEGTLEIASQHGFELRSAHVHDPLGNIRTAQWGVSGKQALIEVAQATGFNEIPADQREPLAASSFGTGELILAALEAGAAEITLAVGGSATTDGGAGMLAALGAQLYQGKEKISGTRFSEQDITKVHLNTLDPRLADTAFTLARDVNSPLLGEQGAVAIFAGQKGASGSEKQVLEGRLRAWVHALEHAGIPANSNAWKAGAGAAGGIGFAALAVLKAQSRPGWQWVQELSAAPDILGTANLVITGEGQADAQSLTGKVISGVSQLSLAHNIPLVLVAGNITLLPEELEQLGVSAYWSLVEMAQSVEQAQNDVEPLLETVGSEIAERLEELTA